MPNKETNFVLLDGYDLHLYGLNTDWFLYIHVPALCCIFVSLFCTSAVIDFKIFSEQICVSISDALLNVTHLTIFKRSRVSGTVVRVLFLLIGEFVSAQLLMTNVAAIHAFGLIYRQKHFKLGIYDSKLLIYFWHTFRVVNMWHEFRILRTIWILVRNWLDKCCDILHASYTRININRFSFNSVRKFCPHCN